jgi:transcriptional regulator with PAS, ATPase and Fis domain
MDKGPNPNLWNDFVKTGNIPAGLDPVIGASWKRSMDFGVNPHKPSLVKLDYKLLELRRNMSRELLELTVPLIENLFVLVKDSANFMTLHDREGYLLYFASQERSFSNWEQCTANVGLRWSEDTIGTTSVSLALATGLPSRVVGPEHYCKKQHNFACFAAPIHDNAGNITGCLNISGPVDKSNDHLLGLIAFGVYSIENQIFLQNSFNMIDLTLEMISEALLILDHKFRVIRGSVHFYELFGANRAELENRDISEILDIPNLKNRTLESKNAFSYSEVICQLNQKTQSYNIKVTPMKKADTLVGVILLFRESQMLNRMANIIAGNNARYTFGDIITQSPQIFQIMDLMKNVATTDGGILIEGESGTGKELFAHAIHSHSKRRGGPFVAVNCASLPRDLVESELFGYEKGAFTGALKEGNPGKFELANGGTIFLDEIGELPLEIQSKLLRVLDTHRVPRIGGKTERLLDFRIIAATNRNLSDEVNKHGFREDMYYRLNIFKFNIPPLRDRKDDIPLLVHHFVQQLNQKESGRHKQVSDLFIQELRNYPWPGNVRELQNVIVRAYYCCDGMVIDKRYLTTSLLVQELPGALIPGAAGLPIQDLSDQAIDQFKRQYIQAAIASHGGNIMEAAKKLGMSRATIYRHIQKYSINLKETRV